MPSIRSFKRLAQKAIAHPVLAPAIPTAADSDARDALKVEARIDPSKYEGMEPLYAEYNVGHFARSFSLSHKIDQQEIAAALVDGILTLTLKKLQQVQPRRIEIK